MSLPHGTWWARVTVAKASGLLLATNDGPDIWRGVGAQLFGDGAELAEYVDEQRGVFRTAAFAGGALTGCLFIGPPRRRRNGTRSRRCSRPRRSRTKRGGCCCRGGRPTGW